jgi:segregation and condensation protein A
MNTAGSPDGPIRSADSPYAVKLPIFEGPLDLLLHLIKRNEVQITDIPIATITDQYLAMLEELPELNLDGAGEYLVMAATLTYVKSRMLLPAPEDEEPEDDPRNELVQQLVEYQRYREVAVALGERHVLARDVFAAPGEAPPAAADGAELPVRDASLGDLLDALRGVLARLRVPDAHEVRPEGLSVRQCVARILAHFAMGDGIEFASLFTPGTHRADVIVTFLALLELIRLRVVRARQLERFGAIMLELAVGSIDEATLRVGELGNVEEWRGGGHDAYGSASDH